MEAEFEKKEHGQEVQEQGKGRNQMNDDCFHFKEGWEKGGVGTRLPYPSLLPLPLFTSSSTTKMVPRRIPVVAEETGTLVKPRC